MPHPGLRVTATNFAPMPAVSRIWENNYAGRLGLGAAIDYALDIGMPEIERRCRMLAGRLRTGLGAIAGVTVLDLGRNPSAIVSFNVAGIDARDVVRKADLSGIAIGASDPDSTRIDSEN